VNIGSSKSPQMNAIHNTSGSVKLIVSNPLTKYYPQIQQMYCDIFCAAHFPFETQFKGQISGLALLRWIAPPRQQ